MDVAKGLVGVGSALFAVALCLWFVFDGFRTGIVKGKRSVARASEPKLYRVLMAIYGALPAWIIGLIVWGVARSRWLTSGKVCSPPIPAVSELESASAPLRTLGASL